jgi:DNA-binding transcriptional ArsR family regulator
MVPAMKEGPDIAGLAALIGDPARANMLSALMSGMALTAGELAREAAVTPQTASMHLAKLVEAKLVTTEAQGRHRYFRLAGPEVAGALEGLMELAARTGRMRTRPGPRDPQLREARICYDHLAGALGVRMHDSFVAQGLIVATPDGLGLSRKGRARFAAERIDLAPIESRNGAPCRACMDWSERKHHLAGRLGAALLQVILARGWAKRDPATRAILFSRNGLASFEAFIGEADEGRGLRRVS